MEMWPSWVLELWAGKQLTAKRCAHRQHDFLVVALFEILVLVAIDLFGDNVDQSSHNEQSAENNEQKQTDTQRSHFTSVLPLCRKPEFPPHLA